VKLGFENKKSVKWLAIFGVVLAGSVYWNFFSDSSGSSSPTPARTPAAAPSTAASEETAPTAGGRGRRGRAEDFLPFLHHKKVDKNAQAPPPADPTLRLDLLAKVNETPAAGSGRDLFNFGRPAPEKLAGSEPVVAVYKPVGPPHIAVAGPKVTPPPPPPPPINLRYYGICTTRADGSKTAFFMDGEEILIEPEGATFKGRYRLLRVGVNSAVVEDLQYKHEQTLPLAEDALPGAGD
jgi:hypothetical protein